MFRIDSAKELVMLIDTSSDPYFKTTPGGIYIYAVDEDLDTDEPFIELEYFDGHEIG